MGPMASEQGIDPGNHPMSSQSLESKRMIITIDGPAGTGKSSVAQMLAARLGLDSLDTGAMYRGIALVTIERGIDPSAPEQVARIAADCELDFDWTQSPPALLLNGSMPGERIREEDVDRRVSIVAGNPEVRTILVEAQRAIASRHPRLVTEGRDQGSVVFPDAEFRFYLDASPEVRADRRVRQSRESGLPADFDDVLEAIKARDHRDETRKDGPLAVPEGATRIDTSTLGLETVVDRLESMVLDRPDAVEGASDP